MKFINNKKLLIISVVTVFLIALATLSLANGSQNAIVNAGANSFSWVNRLISKPAQFINQAASSIHNLINTYKENEQLKPKINTLFTVQAQNDQLKIENQKLKEQLKLKETLSAYHLISGTVISRSPDNWIEQININVGSNDGVKENMAVMSERGIIGKVTAVSANSSKVILLSNTSFDATAISATIQSNGQTIYGIVSGYQKSTKRLLLSNVDLNANLVKGQKIVTSGLSQSIPSGLAIGTVEDVSYDDSGLFKQATIIPEGNLDDIQFVFVISSQNNGE